MLPFESVAMLCTRVELAGLAAAVAEAGQDFERVAQQDVDLLVRAVGQVDVLLLRILRERDVPDRAVAQAFLRDERLPSRTCRPVLNTWMRSLTRSQT